MKLKKPFPIQAFRLNCSAQIRRFTMHKKTRTPSNETRSISSSFLQLAEAFHQDAASSYVDNLANNFCSQVAHLLYCTRCLELKLSTGTARDLVRYEGLHHYLKTYGFALALHPRKQEGWFILSIRRSKAKDTEVFENTLRIHTNKQIQARLKLVA